MPNTQLAGLLCLATLAAACDATGPSPLSVDVAVTPTAFAPGDQATVTIRATNTSSQTVVVTGSSTCILSSEVYRGAARVCPGRAGGCTRDYVEVPLVPGASYTSRQPWAGRDGIGENLPPGIYRVVGLAYYPGEEPVRGGGASVQLTALR